MQTIKQWVLEAAKINEEVQNTFGTLNAAQLNWKPSSEKWSVGQCLDHLVVTNATYFPAIQSIINQTKETTFWEKIPCLPGFFGKALLKSFQPGAQNKLRSPKTFRPAQSNIPADIVARFDDQQQQLIHMIQQTEHIDHQKVIITSPASRFVTYSMEDAINIILVHERRHFLQAQKVMEHTQFPSP